MSKIILPGGYYLEQRGINYTLKYEYIKYDACGMPKWVDKTLGHYGDNLGLAIEKYLKHRVSDVTATRSVEIGAYVKIIDESNKAAVRALERLIQGKEEKHE